jgi:hypothetical protein
MPPPNELGPKPSRLHPKKRKAWFAEVRERFGLVQESVPAQNRAERRRYAQTNVQRNRERGDIVRARRKLVAAMLKEPGVGDPTGKGVEPTPVTRPWWAPWRKR